MYCRKCGSQNEAGTLNCANCGAPLDLPDSGAAAPQVVPNYLVQSIFITVCCCLPLGIPAIIFAAQVNGKIQAGDIKGAMESSRMAKIFCWWGLGLGLVSGIIYAVLQIFIRVMQETAS